MNATTTRLECGHPTVGDSIACATCAPPRDWVERAACQYVDPELFYPEGTMSPFPALRICERCPVRPYCLEAGWEDLHGIWGGWTPSARRGERARRRTITRELIRALATQTRTL